MKNSQDSGISDGRKQIWQVGDVGKKIITEQESFPILMIVTAFSGLIGYGGAPRVAIFMGKGKNDEAEEILGNCTMALIVIALILVVVLQFAAEPLLMLFGASDNTLPYALSYLNIYGKGTLFVMLTMGLNSFINTQGFSKVGMKTVLIGAVCNIILDPVFIFVFGMGVQGAALATEPVFAKQLYYSPKKAVSG